MRLNINRTAIQYSTANDKILSEKAKCRNCLIINQLWIDMNFAYFERLQDHF
jgi:hypothetical protein